MEITFSKKGHAMELRNGDFPYLYFPAIEKTGLVRHLSTTRAGGVSEGYYSTTNISYTIGDPYENVIENFRRIGKVLDVVPEKMVCTQQTHTINVRRVDERDCGRGTVRHREYKDIDGLMTDIPGICLVIYSADCVPLFFLDPVNKAIAMSHSGWRGTVDLMAVHTVEKMTAEFSTDPMDLICGIGPSICQDCYEVSEDVIDRFCDTFEEKYHDRIFYKKENGKYRLDLWETNKIAFLRAGVKEENIHIGGVCTCCNSKNMFSHRASNGKRGLHGSFMVLN